MQKHNIESSSEAAFNSIQARDVNKRTKTAKPPHSPVMRKRHWFLGSVLILTGSWITHTTTATIASSEQEITRFANINEASEPTLLPHSDQQKEKETASLSNIGDQAKMVDAAELESNLSAAPKEPVYTSRYRKIAKGESLGLIFKREGLDLRIPHHIGEHPAAKQLTSIRAGKTLHFLLNADEQLKQIRYPVDKLNEFVVKLDGVTVTSAETLALDYDTQQVTVSAEISSSLYLAAQEAGLSNNLIMEMVRIFGWDVDFVQDIRGGDNFHLVYEEHVKNGDKLDDGNILAAEFTTQGRTYRAIRFEGADGTASYFNTDGDSMLGTFLRSPVEFSRISSRFGKRKHPISKKWKAHKGVDYAAARGTPIRATADGKVTLAGRKGGYGNTVVLRHAGRFSTLYAHMKGFAKGIRSGQRVKQGQIIGYVGSTGMSTGPHLHYEFRVDGTHRNPLTYKTPKASSVSEEAKPAFDKLAIEFGQQLDRAKQSYVLAKADERKDKKRI